ncbi:MAG: hypothetical protein OEV21_07635, partial [Thermoplasmata archaeon]|nr:hypothetical protein [Thermoplasmata archaeon]
ISMLSTDSEGLIVIGADQKSTEKVLSDIFKGSDGKLILTDTKTAEAASLISPCICAAMESLSNELANICEAVGCDAAELMKIIGKEELDPSLGLGDNKTLTSLKALLNIADRHGYRPDLLKAIMKVNECQALRAIGLLKEELGSLKGKRIAILGLAYKEGSSKVENSRAFVIAVELLAQGAKVVGYDALASSEFIRLLPGISYASSARDALEGMDGCIIQTAEEEFARLGKQDFDLMRTKVVIDGRRILSPAKVERYGVRLRAIGLGKRRSTRRV